MADLVFVGGAPRTGTSVLHALLCTSPRANPYVGECSYLSALLVAYERGLSAWESHTRYYFEDQAGFRDFHRKLIRQALRQHREHLGNPEVLVLKNPLLTPRFQMVAELLPKARFVVSVRDPLATIQSRAKVFMRMGHERVTDADVRRFCLEFRRCYADLPEGTARIDYDGLTNGQFVGLAEAGMGDVRPELLWKRAEKKPGDAVGPWRTELTGEPLTARTFVLDPSVLSPEQVEMIEALRT